MLTLLLAALMMGFLCVRPFPGNGFWMRNQCPQGAGFVSCTLGFIPILNLATSSAILQQRRWGIRPVANCDDGG